MRKLQIEDAQVMQIAVQQEILRSEVRIPMKSDTDSDLIRTGFRSMSDSVPEFAGQFLGAKRRSGSSTTLCSFASQVCRWARSAGGEVLGASCGPGDRSPMGVAPLLTEASSPSSRSAA